MKQAFMKKIISAVLVALICGIPAGMYAAGEELIAPENKISEELYEEFDRLEAAGADLTTEKIPVWVWYEDIDQKQVDRETTEQTELTRENLAIDFEMPSPTLINDLQNKKIGSQVKMREYLEQTSVVRKLEKQRVDDYVETRRNISKKNIKKIMKK